MSVHMRLTSTSRLQFSQARGTEVFNACTAKCTFRQRSSNPSNEAGDCLSNRPASSNTRPVSNDMLEENGEDRCHHKELIPRMTAPRHIPRSPRLNERRPGTKASAGRAQSKKLRQSVGQASKPPLGSTPEHGQQPVTLEGLADMTDQMQESSVSRNQPRHPSIQKRHRNAPMP